MGGPRAWLAAAAGVLSLAACGGGNGERRDTRGGTLEVLSAIDADSLDPARSYSVAGWPLLLQLHRPLYAFSGGREPRPDLAEAPPSISPDGRTVTVRIRRGVRFGPPVDREVVAADVRHAIERGFQKSVASPYADLYFGQLAGVAAFRAGRARHIAGIELPDERTLRFRLRAPRGRVLAGALAMPLTAPVPPEVSARADRGRVSRYEDRAVPTGPYRVAGRVRGRRIELVRNPAYRPIGDSRSAGPDRIVWSVRGDLDIAARQVLEGRGRMLGPGPPPPRDVLRALAAGRHRDRSGAVQTTGTLVFTLDARRPPFDDVNVRRAVLAGVDRRALQLSFGGDAAGPLATHYLPPTLPGWREAGGADGTGAAHLARREGDRALARRLLAGAGVEGAAIDVVSPTGQDVGAVLQEELERLGFRVRLRRLEVGAAFQRCASPATRAHVCFGAWGSDFFDGETMLALVFDPALADAEFSLNWSGLQDARLARAITRAKTLVDPTARARAWAEVDRIAVDLAAALPILWQRNALVRSGDVRAGVSEWIGWWDLSTVRLDQP